MEPAHAAQHRTAFLFLCHLILYRRPEEERSDLMSLIGAYTKDVEVDKVIKSAAETLIERGIERGKIEENKTFSSDYCGNGSMLYLIPLSTRSDRYRTSQNLITYLIKLTKQIHWKILIYQIRMGSDTTRNQI